MTSGYIRWIDAVFAPTALPTWLPRLVLFALLVACGLAAALSGAGARRARGTRDGLGGGAMVAAPLTPRGRRRCAGRRAVESDPRCGAPRRLPRAPSSARRYTEMLAENIGQPGFRELLICVHDVDARRDLVFALLQPRLAAFFTRVRAASTRQASGRLAAARRRFGRRSRRSKRSTSPVWRATTSRAWRPR